MRLKKNIHRFLLIIIIGLSFVSMIFGSNWNVLKADNIVVADSGTINIEDGTSVVFYPSSQMEHLINVSGSGAVTINLAFSSYNYYAGSWSGCMSIRVSSSITSLDINIIVEGSCSLYGDNHPGLRLPSNIPVHVSFYLQESSSIGIGSQDGSQGIRNSDYENLDNLSFSFYNTHDSDYYLSKLTTDDWLDSYFFEYEDKGEQLNPSHEHTVSDWIIDYYPTCEDSGSRHRECTTCHKILDIEEISPLGHAWSDVEYYWNEDNTSVTAYRFCYNDEEHYEIEIVDATFEIVEPTCEEGGLIIYTSANFTNSAFSAQEKIMELEALGHDWSDVEYYWSEDNTSVTAFRICDNDEEHFEYETVGVTISVVYPTCDVDGVVTYTSNNFENEDFSVQVKEVILEAAGHYWSSPIYSWNEDYTLLTATRTCEIDSSHIETETVNVTSVVVSPTCEAEGLAIYTSADFTNSAFTAQAKEVRLEALGHDYSEIEYVWSDDYSSLTATRICNNDHSHDETETVSVTFVKVEPTCEVDGLITYTSDNFINSIFSAQVKEVVLDAIGHDYGEVEYVWSDDYSSLTATRICNNDPSHIETETVSVTFVKVEPKCESDGLITYTSANFTNSAFNVQTKEIVLEALGHDLIHHSSKAPTFDEVGWDEYDTCSRCDYSTYNERPKLEKPNMDDPTSQEEFKEAAAQSLSEIIGEAINYEEFLEQVDSTPVDVIADVSEVAANAYNEINDLFANVSEGEKVEVQPGVELTKEEAYEIIQAVVVSTITIASSQEEVLETVNEINDILPENSEINIGSVVSDFYKKVLEELLYSPNKEEDNKERISFSILNIDSTNEEVDAHGVDYSVSASTYQNAVDFVDTSVNNMVEAALRIRECSNESVKSNINHYISGVSAQSFRDFDREKADLEFAEIAYQTILISLQETVMNTLTENYEKAKAGKSGRALSDLEEAYENEMNQISHLHFLEGLTDEECSGCFEDVIIEVMRLKYISILNNKLDKKEITESDFVEYVANATDAETFAPIYKEIFFNWATGKESDDKVQISLQELSDAAIENTSTKINPQTIEVKVLPTEWIIISSIAGLITILLGVYVIASRKKEI